MRVHVAKIGWYRVRKGGGLSPSLIQAKTCDLAQYILEVLITQQHFIWGLSHWFHVRVSVCHQVDCHWKNNAF